MNDEELMKVLQDSSQAGRRQYGALARVMDDELQIDAWLHGRTVAAQGAVLLGKALKDRFSYRKQLLELHAQNLGISPENLRRFILSGGKKLPPLTDEERQAIIDRAQERARNDEE